MVVKRATGATTKDDLWGIAALTRKYLDRYAAANNISGQNISVRKPGSDLISIVVEGAAGGQTTSGEATTNALSRPMGTNTIQITHDDHILRESRETSETNCEEKARHAVLTHALI